MIGIAIANSLGLNFLRGIFGPYKSRVEADGGITEAGQCVDAVSGKLLDASLLLIPSGYKSGKVYAEIPTNGDGDLTFTRASTATRVNSAGLIESVATGVPRLDYSQGSCPSLLLEPQRTNRLLNSENFSTYDKAFGATITFDSGFANPSGANGTYFIYDTDGGSTARFRVANTGYSLGDKISYSLFVKPTGAANLEIGGNYGGESATFNLITKTLVSQGAAVNSVKIEDYANGWTRYTVNTTFQNTIAGNAFPAFFTSAPLSNKIYIYGFQTEIGTYSTTYIPTIAASATRVADSFSRNNIYTNGLITSSGGTWFVELRGNLSLTRDAGSESLFIGDTSIGTTNCLQISSPIGGGRLRILKRVSGIGTQLYSTLTDTIKVAIKWNGSTADVFVNGTKVVTATLFTTTLMEFLGAEGNDVPKFIQQIGLFPTPLSDTDCTTLTTL
jgi:hypothetical protein